MAEFGTARSLSGEMMTAAAAAPRAERVRMADVIDADYVEVAPETRPPVSTGSRPAAAAAMDPGGMSILDKRTAPSFQPRLRRGGVAFWAGGVTLALSAFWLSGGHAMFDTATLLAAQKADARFRIGNVTQRTQLVDGATALLVAGDVTNEGGTPDDLPRIAISVTGQDGATATYRLGTSGQSLAPDAKYSFSSRLDMPKDGVKTVSVTFDQ